MIPPVRELRRELQSILRTFARESPSLPRLTLAEIDARLRWLAESKSEALQESRVAFAGPLWLSSLGIAAVGQHAIALTKYFADPKVTPLFPREPGCKTRPEVALLGLFSGVTNHALATLNLVQLGLEHPARALLRSLLELSWLTLVVSADPKKLALYVAPNTIEEERATWKTHFHFRALNDGLTDIERKLRMIARRGTRLEKDRARQYHYYSMSVHHASIASLLSAFVVPITWRHGRLGFGLFGRASKRSVNTLDVLNEAMAYTVLLFKYVARDILKITFPKDDNDWVSALNLGEAYVRLWIYSGRTGGVKGKRRTDVQS